MKDNEFYSAILYANKYLDDKSADPDGNAQVVSRQFLKLLELNKSYNRIMQVKNDYDKIVTIAKMLDDIEIKNETNA